MQAKIVKAKQDYQCICCEKKIEKGQQYLSQSGTTLDGEFLTYKVCIECAFLITQKTGDKRNKVHPAEFTEKRIPNFLRKLRTEYRNNPKETVKKYWVEYEAEMQKKGKVYRRAFKVSREMYDRKIINMELKKSHKELTEGEEIRLIKGFNEAEKIVKIKKICITKSSNFIGGKGEKSIALLVEEVA